MGRRQRKREAGAPPVAKAPAASGRYTPPVTQFRIRPGWHRVVGVAELVIGVAIVVINYVDYADLRILPGGHNELYFLLGMFIAGGAMWWFGWFDRKPSAEEIRRQFDQQR